MKITDLVRTNFGEMLEQGSYMKDVAIGDNLVLTLMPLNEKQLLDSKLSVPDEARKEVLTYSAYEQIEMLARAIVKINGQNVVESAKEELAEDKDIRDIELAAKILAVTSMKRYLGDFPPRVIKYITGQYNELVREQSNSIKEQLGHDIKDF